VARRPLVLDQVHADGAVGVHVGVEDFTGEADAGWAFGVALTEDKLKGKRPSFPGGVGGSENAG